MSAADAKLQRWIDLLAALLTYRFGVTFAELKAIIPAYSGNKPRGTIERMFERDKDELRAIGIPIRIRLEETDEGEIQRYYVRADELYLPYLTLVSRTPRTRRPIPPRGYRDLETLSFEPDELSALLRAAQLARKAGSESLARDASFAIQKLTYDLGAAIGSAAGEYDEHAATAERSTAPDVAILGDALLRRKEVSFVYRSINRDAVDARIIEPYGLFFSSGHWYLAGYDEAAEGVRSFRVSRMENVIANEKRPQSCDYEIPRDFHLADHARAKGPWELGEESPEEMIVLIRGESGATMAARSHGAAVEGMPNHRCFTVRRVDSFVRWIMSFAGEVVPVAPPRLVEHYAAVIAWTLAVYEQSASETVA